MDVNIEQLAGLPGFSGFAPASEAAVAEAELALGLRFRQISEAYFWNTVASRRMVTS